jgi:hypothetical protein
MIQEHTIGRIVDIKEDGEAVIHAALPNLNHALDRLYDKVEIILPDGRRITPKQRAKIYCLIGEISEFANGWKDSRTVEETKEIMKWDFCLKMMESQERKLFSLSNCDETTATNFITYLVDFIIENDIPMSVPLLDNCEDIGRYVYACIMARKCAVCGKNEAHIHHCEGSRIGAGNDRNKVHQLGREILPLCAVHHAECHDDELGFIDRYHLQKVKADETICRRLKWKK